MYGQSVPALISKNVGNTLSNFTAWNDILFNVKFYGAKGNGTTDDTAAILRAVAAAKAAGGGIVYFPPGTYLISSTIIGDASIIFRGSGRPATTIKNMTLNINMFELTENYAGVQDMLIWDQSVGTRTAGAGIKVTSGVASLIQDVTVAGSYYGIEYVNASQWTLRTCYIANHYKYGVYIKNVSSPDTGDQFITGCVFDETTGATAGIYHESGGGLKVIGNKILKHDYGYDLLAANGVSTSVLIINANSIEAQRIASVRGGSVGSGSYAKFVITGNQFSSPISIIMNTGAYIGEISGNAHVGDGTGAGIVLDGANAFHISGEHFYNYPLGIRLTAFTIYTKIGDNKYFRVANPIDNDSDTANMNEIVQHYLSKFAITSSSVYTNIYQLDVKQFRGATLDITVEGTLQGVGSFVRKITKLVNRGAGVCTVTDVSDTASAVPSYVFDVQFDVTTTSGSVLIGIKRNAADGGSQLDGQISIDIVGCAKKLILLLDWV